MFLCKMILKFFLLIIFLRVLLYFQRYQIICEWFVYHMFLYQCTPHFDEVNDKTDDTLALVMAYDTVITRKPLAVLFILFHS